MGMKKYLLMLLSFVLISLVACGNDEESQTEEQETHEATQQDVEMDDDGMLEQTNDPMEAGGKSNGVNVFEDDWSNIYLVKEWYSNDETDEDGFNTMEFGEYKVKYSVALLEDESEEDVIGFFVETENNTDTTVQYNMDMESSELTPDDLYGIGDSRPGDTLKGFIKADIEDTPDTLEITFEPPWDDEDEFNAEIGEPIELEFSLE